MGRRCVICAGVVAAVLLSGCGSSHKASTSSTTSTKTSTSAAPSAPPTGIRGRVLASNELPNFQGAAPMVFPSSSSWLTAEQAEHVPATQIAAERAMLRRDGFREAVREDLSNGSAAGLSIAEQFGSPQAARAALAFYVAQIKAGESGNFKSFSVHGIRGAEGLGDKQDSGVNIAFSDGPYYYLVGQEGGGPTAIAELNAAALHLYHRVHQ